MRKIIVLLSVVLCFMFLLYIRPSNVRAALAGQTETSETAPNVWLGEQRILSHSTDNLPGHALGLTLCINGQWQRDCSQNPIAGDSVGSYIDISSTPDHRPLWASNSLCNVSGEWDADCRVQEIDLNNWGSDAAARSGPMAHPGDHLKLGLDVVTGGTVPSTCALCEINAPGSGSWHYDVLLHRAIDASLGINAPFVTAMRTTAAVQPGTCLLQLSTGQNYEVLRGMTATLDTGKAAEDVLIGSDTDTIREVNGRLQVRTNCSRSHPAGVLFTSYTAHRGLDLSNTAYQQASVNLGSMFWQLRHATHPEINVDINDAQNREQTAESYRSLPGVGIEHDFQDLGAGFQFKGKVSAHALVSDTVSTRRGTPRSSSEACHQGEMWSDAKFVYVCVVEDSIRRAALQPF